MCIRDSAFNGDVYTGLDAYSLPDEKIQQMQNKLRILSGLYGILKPLDLIQPYRLEMGTSFSVGPYKNLYAFFNRDADSSERPFLLIPIEFNPTTFAG